MLCDNCKKKTVRYEQGWGDSNKIKSETFYHKDGTACRVYKDYEGVLEIRVYPKSMVKGGWVKQDFPNRIPTTLESVKDFIDWFS
jgi:hypothetical protein